MGTVTLEEGNAEIAEYPVTKVWLEYPETPDKTAEGLEMPVMKEQQVVAGGTGAPNSNSAPSFPTLVEDIEGSFIPIPIVKNLYEFDDQDQPFLEVADPLSLFVAIYGSMMGKYTQIVAIDLNKADVNVVVPFFFEMYSNYFMLYKDAPTTENRNQYFADTQEILSQFYIDCLNSKGDTLVFSNEIEDDPDGRGAFWFSFLGNGGMNRLLILVKKDGLWTYNIETFRIDVVGGILYQTKFLRERTENEYLSYLPDYAKHRGSDYMEVEFELIPFNTAYTDTNIGYVYNDYFKLGVTTIDKPNPPYYMGFSMHEVRQDFTLEAEYMVHLGSSKYLVVNVPSNLLTDAISPWEIKEAITLTTETESGEETFDMEVFSIGSTNGLAVNQALLKVKGEGGIRLCLNSVLEIKDVYFLISASYEKDILDDLTSDGWTVTDYDWSINELGWPQDKQYLSVIEGSTRKANRTLTITNFKHTLAIGTLLKGNSGKLVGSTKTKGLLWVKQPFMPDIEMKHTHEAEYHKYQNVPICFCWMQDPYERPTGYQSVGGSMPPCGEFSIGMFGRGSMWYPYHACASFSQYKKVGRGTFGRQVEVKGAYYPERGHGLHDARMEGPDDNGTWEWGQCSPLSCMCDKQTGNVVRVSEPVWAGYARTRGELDDRTLVSWAMSAWTWPKFGNVCKPSLRSYRSTEYMEYTYDEIAIYGAGETIEWRWLPEAMGFSEAALRGSTPNFDSFTFGFGPEPVSQMGLHTYPGEFGASETILETPVRFEDVFVKRTAAVTYPISRNSSGNIIYEFKAYNGEPIQWAWRQEDKPVARGVGDVPNKLNFINVSHPQYLFDKNLHEHRLVLDKGEHTLNFIAPIFDEYTAEITTYPGIQIDTGPIRYADPSTGAFDPEGAETSELYEEANMLPWLPQVSLFSEDDASVDEAAAEEDGRLIDSGGIKFYYNRGLSASIDFTSTAVQNLPLEDIYISAMESPEVEISIDISSIATSHNDLAIPMSFEKATYIRGIELTFLFEEPSGDGTYYDIPAVMLKDSDGNTLAESSYVFCDVGVSTNKTFKLELTPSFSDLFNNRAASFSFHLRTLPTEGEIRAYYNNVTEYEFRPSTHSERTAGAGDYVDKLRICSITNLMLIESKLIDASETIETYERGYFISVGGNEDMSPQATALQGDPEDVGIGLEDDLDNPRRSLNKLPDDSSTVWSYEVSGVTQGIEEDYTPHSKYTLDSKCRSRIILRPYTNGEYITGGVPELEAVQTGIYDDLLSYENTQLICPLIIPPNMKETLEELGIGLSPPTNLVMSNDSVRKLGTVISYPVFTSKGYKITPSAPYMISGYWGQPCWAYQLVNQDSGEIIATGGALHFLTAWAFGSILIVNRQNSYRAYGNIFRETVDQVPGELFTEGAANVKSKGDGSIGSIRDFVHQSSQWVSRNDYPKYSKWPEFHPPPQTGGLALFTSYSFLDPFLFTGGNG